jgi:ribosomal protein S18 acetylase RimI-like enzyme
MNDKEIAIVKVQEAYRSNFVNIVLAVISIVQGLAFNDLAQRFPKIYSTGDFMLYAHFILCFVLLLRIFQTYVTGALAYNDLKLNVFDILIIFVVGLLEYFVFSSLSPENFNISDFYKRFLCLCALAFVAYLEAIRKLCFDNTGVSPENYGKVIRLQTANLAAIIVVISISICMLLYVPVYIAAPFIIPPYGLFHVPQFINTYPPIFFISAIFISLIMVWNIFYSLNVTFNELKEEKLPPEKAESKSEATTPPDSGHAADESPAGTTETPLEIREAKAPDVEQLLNLIADNFLYVYERLFDTSPRLTRRIIRAVLLAWRGRHEWGYRGFLVAVDKETGEVLGFIKIDRAAGRINLAQLASKIILAFVLLRYIGLSGLRRTLINLKEVQSAIVPDIAPNELHINYLAVNTKHQRRGVAQELIAAACNIAGAEGKDRVTLEVREKNTGARKFFEMQGFSKNNESSEVNEIERGNDDPFKEQKGTLIYMKKEI